MDFTFTESKKDPGRDCFVYTAHSALDWIALEDLRGRMERDLFGHPLPVLTGDDPFAPHTTHLLILVNGELKAAAELVAHSPRGLPLAQWSQPRYSRRPAQVRRVAARPEDISRALPELPYGTAGGLIKGCLQWALSHGMSDLVVEVADPSVAERVRQLGGVLAHDTQACTAVATYRIGISELVSRGFRSSNPFYGYLLGYDESVLVHSSTLVPA